MLKEKYEHITFPIPGNVSAEQLYDLYCKEFEYKEDFESARRLFLHLTRDFLYDHITMLEFSNVAIRLAFSGIKDKDTTREEIEFSTLVLISSDMLWHAGSPKAFQRTRQQLWKFLRSETERS